MAGLVFAIIMSLWLNVLQPRPQKDVPERLGELELVGAVSGAEALARVNRLHGLDIELSEAIIAEYTHSSPYHGNSHASIWVGTAANAGAATELIRRMAEGIGKGGSPFVNLRRVTVGGHEVFQVDSQGGTNYFYTSRKKQENVVWISIEASEPELILEEAVRAF